MTLEVAIEKRQIKYKGAIIGVTADFSTAVMRPECGVVKYSWSDRQRRVVCRVHVSFKNRL